MSFAFSCRRGAWSAICSILFNVSTRSPWTGPAYARAAQHMKHTDFHQCHTPVAIGMRASFSLRKYARLSAHFDIPRPEGRGFLPASSGPTSAALIDPFPLVRRAPPLFLARMFCAAFTSACASCLQCTGKCTRRHGHDTFLVQILNLQQAMGDTSKSWVSVMR
jgi:hypothetical protein